MESERPVVLPTLSWLPIPNWTKAKFVGFNDIVGLIRFIENGEVVYIGMESVSIRNVRRFATPGGSAQSHPGGLDIYARRQHLKLEYAVLKMSEPELKRVRDALRLQVSPRYVYETPDEDP